MPTTLKFVTKFASGEGRGWTEVHYRLSQSAAPNLRQQHDSFKADVLSQRCTLLGANCSIDGLVVSYPREGDIASYGTRTYLPGDANRKPAGWPMSLAVIFKDGTFTKQKTVHLRGFWDDVEENEEYHPESPSAAGWDERFLAWKDALIAGGYGWPSKDPVLSARGAGVSYARQADDTVKFTLKAPGMPPSTLGKVVQVRISKINRSNSVLNRQLLVNVNTLTELQTIMQIGAGDQTATGRFNYRATSFVSYASTGSISLGKRAPGKPLNRSPGRSKAKPLI